MISARTHSYSAPGATVPCGWRPRTFTFTPHTGKKILQHVANVLANGISSTDRGATSQCLEYQQHVAGCEPLRFVCGIRALDQPLQRRIDADERIGNVSGRQVVERTEIRKLDGRGEFTGTAKPDTVGSELADFCAQDVDRHEGLEAAAEQFQPHG